MNIFDDFENQHISQKTFAQLATTVRETGAGSIALTGEDRAGNIRWAAVFAVNEYAQALDRLSDEIDAVAEAIAEEDLQSLSEFDDVEANTQPDPEVDSRVDEVGATEGATPTQPDEFALSRVMVGAKNSQLGIVNNIDRGCRVKDPTQYERDSLDERMDLEAALSQSLESRLIDRQEIDGKACTAYFMTFGHGDNSIAQIVLATADRKVCIVSGYLATYEVGDESEPELVCKSKSTKFQVNKFADLELLLQLQENGLLLDKELQLLEEILALDRKSEAELREQQKIKEEERERALYMRLKEKFEAD